jgi:alpha-L-fucosidase
MNPKIIRKPSDLPENFRFATEEEMQWWRDAKFGMFIHWGPASIGGGDISWCRKGGERLGDHQFVADPQIPAEIYDNFYKQFNPTLYNAREWVSIAKSAGMKYMVLTTKHHDGFCLFDTRYTEHRITAPDCPFKRDIVAELADACHEAGMKLGFYYSARDWYHPDYLTENHARYLAFYHSQLLELLCNYKNVDVLWFDHIGGDHDQWDPDLVLRMARTLQPGIIINNRLHISVHKGAIPEYLGDFDTPEQQLGAYQTNRAWESCLCLVGGVWSYKPGGEMMTFSQCLHALLNCAGGDGNLLLNTGPMPDGRIEIRQADRLKEIGDWLAKNGKAIYGTRGGPFRPGTWGVSTHKDKTIYLHIMQCESESIKLPPINEKVVASSTINGDKVDVKQTSHEIEVFVPESIPDKHDTIVILELDKPV